MVCMTSKKDMGSAPLTVSPAWIMEALTLAAEQAQQVLLEGAAFFGFL
jgi:hypothetical protein